MGDGPEDPAAQLRRLRRDGALAEARAVVDAQCRERPDDPGWRMEQGTQSLYEGRPDVALSIFEPLADARDFGGAFECALKAAELRADRGDVAGALDMLARAETRHPGHDALQKVRNLIGLQSHATRRRSVRDAIGAFRTGAIGRPGLQNVIGMLDGYLRDVADDPEMALELARLLHLAGRPGDAIPVLRSLVARRDFAGQLESLIGLARALDLTGEPGAAWGVAETIRDGFPDHSAFPVLATELLARRGRRDDAIRLIEDGFAGLAGEHRSAALGALVEARAIRAFETLLDLSRVSRSDLQAMQADSPYPAAGIIMLTKDEADMLGHNLEHHHRLGFRRFCIVDNQSADGTAARIERFRQDHPDALVFSCHDQIAGHYQADKMGVFMDMFVRYAAIAGITLEWLFFLDTDELIACTGPGDAGQLRTIMSDPGCDIIVFHWLLCASPRPLRATPQAASPFESFPVVKATRPPTTKVAVRVASGCRPTEGNHWVHGFTGSPRQAWIAAEHGWLMFHFTIRSFEQLKSKVVNGGRAFLDTTGLETHGGHWKARYERYRTDGDNFIQALLQDHIVSVSQGGTRLPP